MPGNSMLGLLPSSCQRLSEPRVQSRFFKRLVELRLLLAFARSELHVEFQGQRIVGAHLALPLTLKEVVMGVIADPGGQTLCIEIGVILLFVLDSVHRLTEAHLRSFDQRSELFLLPSFYELVQLPDLRFVVL